MWILAAAAGLGLCAGAFWLLTFRYVALGDSLAAGVGSFTFFGYVPRLALLLTKRLKRVVLTTNLGRFGWTSQRLLNALRTDQGFRKAVTRAQLITVDIGGNDLLGCRHQEACLEEALVEFRQNWQEILREIRRLNPKATLLTMTLYNPVPLDDVRRPAIDGYIARMNAIITQPELLKAYRVHGVAPAYDLFAGRECDLCWFCRIGDSHATDEGYAVIAGAMDSLISK